MTSSSMFTEIQAVSVPGSTRSDENLTEDAFYASQNVLIVMDGATVVNGDTNHFRDSASDAHWLSHRGCSLLAERFEDIAAAGGGALHVESAIFATLCSIEREYIRKTRRKVSLMTPADAPSSTLSFAIVSGKKLIVGQLGDSPISVKMRNGSFSYMEGDEMLLALDAKNRRDISELVGRGWEIGAAHHVLLPQFSEMREVHCNNGEDDSYNVFCFIGKEYAKPKVTVLDMDDVESIVLYTDGYADMFLFESNLSFEELHNRSMENLRSEMEKLTAYQDADADCREFVRFKKSDDTTVIAARIG